MAKYTKRKDGRYATTVTIGYKDNGKPDTVFVAAKTVKELEDKVLEVKMKMKQGEMVKSSETPLRIYLQDWYETYKEPVIAYYRTSNYKSAIKQINEELGDMPLCKIVRSDVQKLINKHIEHPTSCKMLRQVLRAMYKSAIDDKLVVSNPTEGIAIPKQPKAQRRALTELEKEAIKKADFTDMEKAVVMILFYFGIRRGELLALTQSDFDFKKNVLTINKVIVFNSNRPVLKPSTKSDAGNREIPIPAGIKRFLTEYLKSLDTLVLFPGKNNEYLSDIQYKRFWNRIIKKMNNAVTTEKEKQIGVVKINGLTAHIFRHNYCTMLYYSGVSIKKAVQLMGHANPKMIMEVYAHLDEEKEAVQEKLDNAINL